MKKLLLSLFGCVALALCGLGFAGCDQPQLEVKDITINTTPQTLTYFVGQDLNLSGGTIKVVYEDDSIKVLPMTLATPNIKTFNKATNDQIVVLSFGGKTTKFGVNVLKGTLAPVISYSEIADDNNLVVNDSFTGEELDFLTHLNMQSLPQNEEDMQITCFYKDEGSADENYSTNKVIHAGRYDVKLTFRNATNYNDLDVLCHYVVHKANIKDLVFEGNTLDYNSHALTSSQSAYGTTAIVSDFWTQSDGYLGEVPLQEDIKLQLEYAYKPVGELNYTSIQQNTITKKHQLSLPVGEYMIKISIHDNTDINDEVLAEFRYVVVKADLVLGQDYNLYLSDGTNQVLIDQNFAMDFDQSKTYTLVLQSSITGLTLNEGITYYLGNSSLGSTTISSAGQYRAEYSVEGNQNYKSTGAQIITFTLN